jgi:uncharacterized membrane protein YebE (DUF533 family)
MFDARSLLESLVRGPAQSAPRSSSKDPMSELGDLLRQFTQSGAQGGAQPEASAGSAEGSGLGAGGKQPSIGDILGNLFPGAVEPPAPQAAPQPGSGAGSSGGLGDIFSKIQEHMQNPSAPQAPGAAPPAPGGGGQSGSPLDVLGQIFGQATQGAQEGAGRIGQATGMNELIEKMSGGRSAEELLEQVKRYMSENKLGTGAALGGLGALILGTQTGRSMAGTAAKIGALALIGGLAYKSYQNYQQGRPLISGVSEVPEPAPAGSGFEEAVVGQDIAVAMIRAMIAAAAADGRIDAAEQQAILGNLQSSGLGADAEEFIAQELNRPASIDEIAAGVRNRQEAIRVYTAARFAIEPDTAAEQQFLYQLGSRLGIDEELMAHVDAQTRAAA